jgi:peroxiredoxin
VASPGPKAGEIAPDFSLPSVYGETVSLMGLFQQGHSVLLVFLRHLG